MRLVPSLGVLFLAACSSVGPMPADGVDSDDEMLKTQIRFADDLRDDVEIERPVLERTAENLLQVSLPIRNVSGRDLQLLVQVEFLDATGNRYNDDTGRVVFYVPRGTTKEFKTSSMLSKASDYVAHLWRNK
jgi:hypothetical protein